MSIFRSERPARGLARFVGPALLLFLSPLLVAPAESAGDPPHRLYLPIAQSFAESLRWSNPVQIDASGRQSGSQLDPVVALDDFGNSYALWREQCPDCRNYFSYRAVGTAGWSAPEPLHDTGRLQAPASITTDPQGNLYVFWSELGGPFLLRRSPTGSWSQPEVVTMPEGSGDFQLAADAMRRLHLLYKIYQGDYQAPIDLFYSFRDETGVWHAPEQVNDRSGSLTYKDGPSGTPSLAVDGAGNAHAAWREVDYWGNWLMYSSDRRPDGSWSPNEVVELVSGANAPSLAADEKGNLYLAFAKNKNGVALVRFAYRPAGEQWLPSVQINAPEPGLLPWGEYGGPSLQIDRQGAVYVIWPTDEFEGDARIYFDWRAPITGDATDPTRWHDDEAFVTFYVAESQGLAAGPVGNLIAVWTQRSPALGELPLRKIYAATRP